MKKNILPMIVFLIIAASLTCFIVYRTIHAVSYEEAFTSTVNDVCRGFARSESNSSDGYSLSTFSRANPQMTIVLNTYRKASAASDAFDNRLVYGIGTVPEGGYTQNYAHDTRVYFIHDHTGKYYCCGIVGDKLVFGMRSDDGNYFSQLFTEIRDSYFTFCMENKM